MIEEHSLYYVFLDFYHLLTWELTSQVLKNKVHPVNAYALMMAACLAWPLLANRQITIERTVDLPFLTFSLGSVAGGAVGYFDQCASVTDRDAEQRVQSIERGLWTDRLTYVDFLTGK